MRVNTAPVGQFVVGDVEWLYRADVLMPPPTLGELIRDGGGVLSYSLRLEGAEQAILPARSASVTVEDDRSPTRALTANILLPDGWDVSRLRHAFAAANSRIRVEATLTDPRSGASWSWLLATTVTMPPQVGRGPDGLEVSISCPDASVPAKRAMMRGPYAVGQASVVFTIADLLSRWVPWLAVDFTLDLGQAVPAALGGWGADPWTVCRDLARGRGADLRIDGDGVARLHWYRRASSAPDVTWEVGRGGVLLDSSLHPDADPAPASCLIEWGPQGEHLVHPAGSAHGGETVVYEGDASTIQTLEQARTAAAVFLAKAQARNDRVEVRVPVDYRRDVGDIVRVVEPVSGLDYTGRLTGLTWELGSPTMTCGIAREEGN